VTVTGTVTEGAVVPLPPVAVLRSNAKNAMKPRMIMARMIMATDQLPLEEESVFGLLMTVAIKMCVRLVTSVHKLNTNTLNYA